jgi:hypothetical protein
MIYFVGRFDMGNNGFLVLQDFIAGWNAIADTPGGSVIVDKIKTLTSNESMLL